jgi:hypothetical protein
MRTDLKCSTGYCKGGDAPQEQYAYFWSMFNCRIGLPAPAKA